MCSRSLGSPCHRKPKCFENDEKNNQVDHLTVEAYCCSDTI